MRRMHTRMRPSSRNDSDALEAMRRELGALKQSIARVRIQSNGNVETLEAVAERGELVAPALVARVALVGPTGVGKTTTIAKLAARAALVDGLRVGIVTMDTFRIGAEEQIRAYADLIGVPMQRCSEPARLAEAIARLGHCDRVFIDTPGYGPSESEALANLGRALMSVPGIDVHLVVAAAASSDDLDRAAARYRVARPTRLLFTKVDEAHHAEELVRAPIRLGMPVRFVATGQRVPEDIEEVSRERLLHLAETGLELATEAA
jgi:flagellar biosynthesis protein FlhF